MILHGDGLLGDLLVRAHSHLTTGGLLRRARSRRKSVNDSLVQPSDDLLVALLSMMLPEVLRCARIG